MRICPICGVESEEKICPTDRYETIDIGYYRAQIKEDPFIGKIFKDKYRIIKRIGKGGVEVDGKDIGFVKANEHIKVSEGLRDIKVVADGYKPFGGSIKVVSGETITIALEKDVMVVKKERKRLWTWISLGGGGLFGSAGLIFQLLGKGEWREVKNALEDDVGNIIDMNQIDGERHLNKSKTYYTLSYTFYGLGITSAITSIVLYFVEGGKEERQAFLPLINKSNDRMTFSLKWRF